MNLNLNIFKLSFIFRKLKIAQYENKLGNLVSRFINIQYSKKEDFENHVFLFSYFPF